MRRNRWYWFNSLILSLSHSRKTLKFLYLSEGILFIIILLGCIEFKPSNMLPYNIENFHYPTQRKLTGWDDERLKRIPQETDMEYANRMNKVVGSSFYHCDYQEKDNFFEILAAPFTKTVKEKGFLYPGRNCGFCHQAAYLLAKVLNMHGIDATPLGMNGHVVVLMKDGGLEYIWDPDYVVGPLPYKDDMLSALPAFYGDGKHVKWLHKAYSTRADDRPYSSMATLNAYEKEQNKILFIIKFCYGICAILFIVNSLLILLSLRKKIWPLR